MVSNRRLVRPANIRKTLVNRQAISLSMTGEVSKAYSHLLAFHIKYAVIFSLQSQKKATLLLSDTISMDKFLANLHLDESDVKQKFKDEHITLDMLMEMDTRELKADM